MIVGNYINCSGFPCSNIDSGCYIVPGIDIDPDRVSIVMISECAPADSKDYFYHGKGSLFAEITVQAFRGAGADVSSI